MPLPHWLARFNFHITNHFTSPLAKRVSGWGVVVHTGRTTRRQYRTPVFVFRHGDRFIMALTYGRESQWVRNVLAQGGCELETEGSKFLLSHPRLFHDDQRSVVPVLHRFILGVFKVSDFLELTLTK
ncbi:MAG TPA: nitroreductase/quinone reductase family protein [Candidatus Binataceae bacterium]|nr:nitroreductase/quinone reductase family protein [Candidatus Binataceae bacterium]